MAKDAAVLKSEALSQLENYIDSLNPKHQAILSYWIKDYVRFLKKEDSFDPRKLIRYKRGSIVKVHLGYKIGSEEGGLHYGVVIDISNPLSSNVATIIPLTSVKPGKDVTNLPPSQVYLGDEIYQGLNKKLNDSLAEIEAIQQTLRANLQSLAHTSVDKDAPDAKMLLTARRVSIDLVQKELDIWREKDYYAQKMSDEIGKMKRGSIALVGQITTISKIRIYDPLYPNDTLHKIRLSDESLTLLDQKLKCLFTKTI